MPCRRSSRREFLLGGCSAISLATLGLSGALEMLPWVEVTAEASGPERRYPVPASDGVSIDRSAQIILVRHTNKVYAMALSCPHENAAVKWLAKDRRFQCTKHDSQYTPEGTYTTGHTTRNLDRFPIRLDGASVVVTTDRVYRSDKNLEAWTAARVDVLA
jgi:Rieske Fe-S protein